MPRGMIVARWDDRLGITPEAAYPPEIENVLEHDDLLTIFSTHAISEKAGILAMRIKRLNIISYYSGLPEGEETEQYFVVVILEQEEDPASYEERLTEIAKLIIASIDKPGFNEMFAKFYEQLIKMEKITEEQRYAFIFRDRYRRLLLQKLTNGPMTKEGLAKWISKEVDQEVTDIDGLLAPLKKTELIEEINISKGKKVSLEYIFLMRDVAVIRVPNVEIFKAAKSGQMPEDIRQKYIEEVENFFKNYRISNADAGILGEIVSDPDMYEIINVLRNEYIIRAELPMKLSRDIPNLEQILKDLAEKKIITAVKDKKGRIWLFLLSDIKFPNFFPEYMIDVIRRRWKEGTIAKEIALKHLELLRAEYIATEAPKYRRKLLKAITEYFANAEALIKKEEYDQAATIVDTMADYAREIGERGLGELLSEMGKLIREDKERYIEEKFPEDRVKVIEILEAIAEKDKEKEKPKKKAEIKMKAKEKPKVFKGASAIGKMDGAQAEAKMKEKQKKAAPPSYVAAESVASTPPPSHSLKPSIPTVSSSKSPSTASSTAAPSFVKSASVKSNTTSKPFIPKVSLSGSYKENKKKLQDMIRQANKEKNLTRMAQLLGELAKLEESQGNIKEAANYREKQNKIAIQALIIMRNQYAAEADAAAKAKDYAKAAELYAKCKSLSNKLFKAGHLKEADNAKKFANLEKQTRAKI
ncbi:MAG: hypothetical protein ACTSRZ_01165 [Promethearchaeota archaeon]